MGSTPVRIDGPGDGDYGGGGDQQGLTVAWPKNGKKARKLPLGVATSLEAIATTMVVGVGLK